MTAVKSFQFVREQDAVDPDSPPEPKLIEINGTPIRLIDELSSIDVVLFAAGTMEGGHRALLAVDVLLRTVVDPEDYDRFIGVARDLKLGPAQLAELSQGLIEVYTVRPTEPS